MEETRVRTIEVSAWAEAAIAKNERTMAERIFKLLQNKKWTEWEVK
jgi:post-segregation antitoxin (ccd killing protein)